MEKKIQSYKTEIKHLKEEIWKLKGQVNSMTTTIKSVQSIFTHGKVRKLENPWQRIVWKREDISNALCLHAAGSRAYMHLYKKGYPLPCISSLKRWSQKLTVSEGLLTSSLDLMAQNTDLKNNEKICMLTFDEMKIMECFEYESKADFVRRPKKYGQVVLARGLKKSWRQPVYFNFDCKMSESVLMLIIKSLNDIGFPVVGIVSDMAPTNRGLWSELNITMGNFNISRLNLITITLR